MYSNPLCEVRAYLTILFRPTGGATVTAPSSWDHPDLKNYYILRPSFSARTATRPIPASTGSSSPHSSGPQGKKIGAIVGGVVGGLVAVVAVLCLVLFCLRRRKRNDKKEKPLMPRTPTPPVELASTPFRHEMSNSTSPGKYNIELEERASKGHSNYIGVASVHPHSPGHEYPSPYSQIPPSYGSASPPPAATYQSSHHGGYSQHTPRHQSSLEQFHSTYNSAHTTPPAAWSPNPYSSHSPGVLQREYSYPTPTSPVQQVNFPLPPQAQLYYPPPPEPRTQYSPPSFMNHSGSPTGTHHSGEHPYTHSPPPGSSTLNTPAQFYAQPAVINHGGGMYPDEKRPGGPM